MAISQLLSVRRDTTGFQGLVRPLTGQPRLRASMALKGIKVHCPSVMFLALIVTNKKHPEPFQLLPYKIRNDKQWRLERELLFQEEIWL